MNTPKLDLIASDVGLTDTNNILTALRELEERHNTALKSNRGIKAELQCTIDGWVIYYDGGYSRPTELRDGRYRWAYPEDAIGALHKLVEEWIVQAEREDAIEATEALIASQSTVPLEEEEGA